jgi:hypothetical protein
MGTEANPAAEYHAPALLACSDVRHHEDVMITRPGLIGASKTPRRNRPVARPGKLVAALVQARTVPIANIVIAVDSGQQRLLTP